MRYVSPSYERSLGGHAATVNDELPMGLAALHSDDRMYLAERLLDLLEAPCRSGCCAWRAPIEPWYSIQKE